MIELAEFETSVVGHPVYRLLDAENCARLITGLEACPHHIIAKIHGDNLKGINQMLAQGFRYSCASLRLKCSMQAVQEVAPGEVSISRLSSMDLPSAYEISDTAFCSLNRYADDPFLGSFSAEIHRCWISNSVKGYANLCLKAELGDRLAGFATLHLSPPDASIGLIAVGSHFRRKGVGMLLANRLMTFALANGCQHMQVVTESENSTALNFYIDLGFRPSGSELSLYRSAR